MTIRFAVTAIIFIVTLAACSTETGTPGGSEIEPDLPTGVATSAVPPTATPTTPPTVPPAPTVKLLTHTEPLATDEHGNGIIFGTVMVRDGCLRLDASNYNARDYTMLLVWPGGYSLGMDAGGLHVKDAAGELVVRPGDDARFTGSFPGEKYRDTFYRIDRGDWPRWMVVEREQKKAEWRQVVEQPWQERLGTECSGPFLLIGDDATAVGPEEAASHVVPGPVYFPVNGHVRGGSVMAALLEGDLALDGECLRVDEALIIWPPGFKPHVEGGQVEVRNGGGKTIARVGDRLGVGGGYYPGVPPFRDNPVCLGPFYLAGNVKVLPPEPASDPTPEIPPTPVPTFDISPQELQAIYEELGFTFAAPEVDPHGREYVAGTGPEDDPALASTIRLFGSSGELHWVDLRLSVADPKAEDAAEKLWRHAGALFMALDPGWEDPEVWFNKTLRWMELPYGQAVTRGQGDGAYFTVETDQNAAGKLTHIVMAHPVVR